MSRADRIMKKLQDRKSIIDLQTSCSSSTKAIQATDVVAQNAGRPSESQSCSRGFNYRKLTNVPISPSKAVINYELNPQKITKLYSAAGPFNVQSWIEQHNFSTSNRTSDYLEQSQSVPDCSSELNYPASPIYTDLQPIQNSESAVVAPVIESEVSPKNSLLTNEFLPIISQEIEIQIHSNNNQYLDIDPPPVDQQKYFNTNTSLLQDVQNSTVLEETVGIELCSGNAGDVSADDTTFGPSKVANFRSCKSVLKSAYTDFLDEEERILEYDCDSSSWEGSSEEEDSTDETASKKILKRKEKKRKAVVAENGTVGESAYKKKRPNKASERQQLYRSGKKYKKKNGIEVPAKEIGPNPCQLKKCTNRCDDISEERRLNIFNYFWSLSPQRRRDWLVSMSKKESVKRKRVKHESRKSNTFLYFINEGEGQRQVCLKFLLSTLNVSQRYVYYTHTLSNACYGLGKEDMRGKTIPPNKTKDEVLNSLRDFITSLPAVPSHYARKDSTKLYLPNEFKNITNLYNLYKKREIERGIDVVSERLFRKIFTEEFNIGIHIPKKDKCVKCVGFENNPRPETVVEKHEHDKEKVESKKRFEYHQKIHEKNRSVLCVSFDLQKVLNTPYGESMLLYYSRKLAVYNFTFYESTTRKGHCYYWNESLGKRGANEIATCLVSYMKKIDDRGTITKLLLYCDSCPGQNKNRTVLASLHYNLMSCKNVNVIQINYLLPGHTYMPVDSMHSVIEKSIAKHIIWAPSQWPTVFELARHIPEPYEVHPMLHKDFTSWDDISDKYFKGNLAGKISKIRVATFKKSEPNKMYAKFSMASDAQEEIIQISGKVKNPPNCNLYPNPLLISKAKYNDLDKLCQSNVIPLQYHNEYSNLPRGNSVKDVLPETDEED
uniref:Uncharacterized protein LOC114326298 n=1 Tax=Diabrotica virgifera virgifera TaxID=50390 RepID=A0A6P7FAA9_DIAVI